MNTPSDRYYVRRRFGYDAPVWTVADRYQCDSLRASCVGVGYQRERTARKACERANREWQRFRLRLSPLTNNEVA